MKITASGEAIIKLLWIASLKKTIYKQELKMGFKILIVFIVIVGIAYTIFRIIEKKIGQGS